MFDRIMPARSAIRRVTGLVLALSLMAGCGDTGATSGDAGEGNDTAKTASKEYQLAPLPVKLPEPAFLGTPAHLVEAGLRFDPDAPERRPEFLAPSDVQNVALGKPVTSSDPHPIIGSLDLVTNGDKNARDADYVELGFGPQWVQIDLEREYDIYAIVFWQRHDAAIVYNAVIVQVSNDPEFKEGVTILFNNDHDNSAGLGIGEDYQFVSNHEGKLVDAGGVRARYFRVQSSGNTLDDFSHFTEVEVWAR
ncbi:MAG: hypothetical protein JJU36_00875 [Phycisphaeraceae bacterium]|nr:hypothetical protein [Phycisphaeraceae bacterium]